MGVGAYCASGVPGAYTLKNITLYGISGGDGAAAIASASDVAAMFAAVKAAKLLVPMPGTPTTDHVWNFNFATVGVRD